jgi:hypothetical protein
MEIDFSKGLLTVDGRPIVLNEGESVTLKFACIEALMNCAGDKNSPMSENEKLNCGMLAKKIFKSNKPIRLSADEIVLIKKCSHITYPTAQVYCAIVEVIDPSAMS